MKNYILMALLFASTSVHAIVFETFLAGGCLIGAAVAGYKSYKAYKFESDPNTLRTWAHQTTRQFLGNLQESLAQAEQNHEAWKCFRLRFRIFRNHYRDTLFYGSIAAGATALGLFFLLKARKSYNTEQHYHHHYA